MQTPYQGVVSALGALATAYYRGRTKLIVSQSYNKRVITGFAIAVVHGMTCGHIRRILISIGASLFLTGVVLSQPFPGVLPGTEIGAGLQAGYEPSGACWHSGRNKLFLVHDGGVVTSMNTDGSGIQNWNAGGDLEGICVADPASNFVYLGVENPDSVREFNLVTGQVVRSFDLTPWMAAAANSGLEALEFVPNASDPEGGLFYAGLQSDGSIHVFRLPIRSSTTSTSVVQVNVFTPVPGRSDISGLDYDQANDTLYAIWDGANKIRAMSPNGVSLGEWDLPGNDQEGIALLGCDLYVAEDVGKEVWRYPSFPDGDDDLDGIANCVDACADTPAGMPVDAEGCPTGGCQSPAECDDGIFCNGVEQCQGSSCQSGVVPCAGMVCHEVLRACIPGAPIPPIAAVGSSLWPKNRYISFQPTNVGAWVAFRVTKTTVPVGTCWVSAPNSSGRAQCVNNPVFRVWSEPVLHVGDCEIVPASTYQIAAASSSLTFSTSLTVMTAPIPTVNGKLWGDVAGAMNASGWTPPDRMTNLHDVLAVVSFINSAPPTLSFEAVNLQSQSSNDPCLNSYVNVADVLIIVEAVRGTPFPFGVNPVNCPPCP